MKKHTFLLFAFMLSLKVSCQTTASIKADMPTIVPPSPTVAALMKFEEVAVNNYTGIPSISIPIANIGTTSKDVSINISLDYHAGSTSTDEIASYTGLGWSLIAGGTISRTVKGLPDECFKFGSSFNRAAKGIYNNGYYGVTFGTDISEYLWQAFEKGVNDTEHDLYQFNFMGHTGRFYVSNESTDLEVIKLYENDNLKIDVNYTADLQDNDTWTKYTITGFTIYDDKGYKYIFDTTESTLTNRATQQTAFNGIQSDNLGDFDNTYTSAFHLSKIFDPNNNTLATFKYTEVEEDILKTERMENKPIPSELEYVLQGLPPDSPEPGPTFEGLIPKTVTTHVRTFTATKKLSQIFITNKANIHFEMEQGRSDYVFMDHNEPAKLKKIIIKDWSDSNTIKQFQLSYNYSAIYKGPRLMLAEVKELNNEGTVGLPYTMSYRRIADDDYIEEIGKDYWGYYNEKPFSLVEDYTEYKGTSKKYCTLDVLQKMTLPTGGCQIFDFESNKYSFVGDTALTIFDENPDNMYTIDGLDGNGDEAPYWNYHFTPTTGETPLRVSTNTQYIKIAYDGAYAVDSEGNAYGGAFWINKGTGLGSTVVHLGHSGFYEMTLLPNTQYYLNWALLSTIYGNGDANIIYQEKKEPPYQFLYGGGIRIRKIGYFKEKNVDPLYYSDGIQNSILPSKEKTFEYKLFDDVDSNTPADLVRSSGSLVFPKPVFNYSVTKNLLKITPIVGSLLHATLKELMSVAFNVKTEFNNLLSVRTQGSDIGYSNVKVSETGNGYSRYSYTSPITDPEDYSTSYPFIASKNIDYRRGLIKKEEHFREDGKELQEINYDYDFVDDFKITGFTAYSESGCPISTRYTHYQDMVGCLSDENCDLATGWGTLFPVGGYLAHRDIEEAFGWAKLITKNTTSYFYDGAGSQHAVHTDESFTYNPLNKKLATHSITGDQGNLETRYFYHTGDSPFSFNRISEIDHIEEYKSDNLISTSKVEYSKTFPGNQSYLPAKIEVSKGSQPLEERITYDLYDSYGHVLQVRKKNGSHISYIWGYNSSQVVAKIENAAYADIPASLITDVVNASDAGDEAGLIIAQSALRDGMPQAMVTTYTYKPVGVSTVTDPKADKVTYSYDGFGRLSSVRDKDGNLVSESEYYYQNQN